jgi:hypothetical protein
MPTAFVDQLNDVHRRIPALMRRLPVKIRTEEEGILTIQPNRVQEHLWRDTIARGGFSTRENIHKARKHGITTWEACRKLIFAFMVEGYAGAVVVHNEDTASRVFKIIRWAYDSFDQEFKDENPLNEDRRDAFEFKNKSTLYVYTAGTRGVGRSETFHDLHLTEVAFWQDAETSATGLQEAVPRIGHICRESTPNGRAGIGGWWYEQCMASLREEGSYKLYYYPWWWGDENFLQPAPDEHIVPTDEEMNIIAAAQAQGFKLELGHLKWRRNKIIDLGEKFFQEHPEDPETSFLLSGSPVIDPNLLRRLTQRSDAQFVMRTEKTKGLGDSITWKMPGGTSPFIVSVDVAEGLPHNDASVINVWQNTPEEFVNARRDRGWWTFDELAYRAVEVAKEYHDAMIIVEVNSIGRAVMQRITGELHYSNIYYRVDGEGVMTETPGWRTGPQNKKFLIEEFIEGVNMGSIVSWDRMLWSEAANIVRDDMGRPVTPKKKHDDVFMAACIAYQGRHQAMHSGGGAMVVSYA